MEDGEQRFADLVKELVHRLLYPQSQNPNSSSIPTEQDYNQALKYSIGILSSRILSSRTKPSIASDEAAMVESIKRHLANSGRSSEALAFADICSKFMSKTGSGSVKNKWSVLYLLKKLAEDKKSRENVFTSRVSSGVIDSALSGGLPDLYENTEVMNSSKSVSTDFDSNYNEFRGLSEHTKNLWSSRGLNGGILNISKDTEDVREKAYTEFAELIREENEVPEEMLVRDVLYSCQGIDGKFVKFDSKVDGYVLPESIKVSRSTRIMVRKLCEIGWLFRKVSSYIKECTDQFQAEDVGTVGQAFCGALQDELREYYKLLAVLETQVMNPIPLFSETNSGKNYLSLRRLSVWVAEPMVKMRLMAVLVDSCRTLKGGAMAGAIHKLAQNGDPLVKDFMKKLLHRVCSPLFKMVWSWVLKGELEDMFVEFFISSQQVKVESLWREGYNLHYQMLPSFISQSLAQRILRTGKSINFLRVCCDDRSWATEADGPTGGKLGYGETDALETLVTEASKRVDQHLLNVMYRQYKFKEHCLAIKRYLLLGQGDFVQYLMDIVGPELSQPANTISSFKLAGLLESAIRSSNAQYDESDILDRLRVRMMPHGAGDRGWDVFSLEYDARVPLNTFFTENVMSRYLRIFNFLWKLRRVEHALSGVWKGMKPNCVTSRLFSKLPNYVQSQLVLTSRKCQVLWGEMNHFVANLQYYIMFEVLEVSWADFSKEMDLAKDLDDLIGAHEKYLSSIVEKSFLGETSQKLNDTFLSLFDLILKFQSHANRLFEGINELQSRIPTSDSSQGQGKLPKVSSVEGGGDSWLGEGRKDLTRRAGEFLRNMRRDIDEIGKQYSSDFEGFVSHFPLQKHVELKFLMFRLDFNEFYTAN